MINLRTKKTQNTSSFDQFETKPNNDFGFDQFSKFDQKTSVVQSGFDQKPKQQAPASNPAGFKISKNIINSTLDLLDLDFGGSTQVQPNNPPPAQNGGFDNFFTQPSQPINQAPAQQFGGFATQAPMNQSQGSTNKNNLNDLMGLEFGAPSTQHQQTLSLM